MQTIQNGTDLVLLYAPLNLYLKPQANLTISLSIPQNVGVGKTISNFDIMDKLRQMILPDSFSILKVSLMSNGIQYGWLTLADFRFLRQQLKRSGSRQSSMIATSRRT